MKKTLHKPWILILTIGLGILLNPLNSSMISVAVTRMQEDFVLTFADASWLISVFYIASAAGQPVMGKLSDMFGPKKLFMAGLALVVVSCIIAPFAPNFYVLLIARALQAIGSSTLFPSGMSMIRANITEGQGKALGIISIFASTSAAFGPSIGGFLIDAWDWQAIFVVNFPIIIISFVLAIFVLPNTGQGKFELKRIDFIGISLFIIAIVTLILFLLSLDQSIRWWALVVTIISFVAFYKYEHIVKDPFINMATLKSNKTVSLVYLQFMIINLIYYCYFFGLPTFLQQKLEYSASYAGLIMLALAGFSVIIAPFAGSMIDRLGAKIPSIIGAVLLLIGTSLLLTYHMDSSIWWLLVIMAILGLSTGFNNIATQTALYENTSKEDTGSASGLFQTSRYLGSILSASLLGLTFNHQVNLENFHLVVTICIAFAVLVVGLSLKLPNRHRSEKISR